MHLFPAGKNTRIILELFRLLDIHSEGVLNDVQFWAFMKTSTDMTKNQIYKVFDMLDVDCSGTLDFDEFYLLICILIAANDNEEKHFIYRHSRTVFDLLDEDSSGNISAYEFETFGFLFNLHGEAIRTIFSEFDVSGDQVFENRFLLLISLLFLEAVTVNGCCCGGGRLSCPIIESDPRPPRHRCDYTLTTEL